MALNAGGGRIWLRPLEIGDVLDGTFQVYRRTFVPIVTVMAVVVIPTTLLSLPFAMLAGFNEATLARFFQDSANLGAMIGGFVVIVLLAVVASLAQLVAAGAAVRVASNGILGQPISVRDAYREALSRFGSLSLVSLCVGIPVALLVVTCIGIPVAVFVGLGWSLVFQAILLEGRGAIDSMRRSWQLVDGHRWRLLASMFLTGLIVALLVSVPAGLFGFLTGIAAIATGGNEVAMMAFQVGDAIFQAAGQSLFGAIGYITATLLYYDLLVRKEAFDLQQRLPNVEIAQPTGPQQYPQYPQQSPQYPPQNSGSPPYPQQPSQVPPRFPPPPPSP